MINYDLAKKELESGEVSNCKDFFRTNNYGLEYGYCLILEGNLSEAERVLRKVKSLRADWAVRFIPFMKGYIEVLPTYLQIRNFFEIDVNLLIMASQADSVSYVLGGADILYTVNPETYKYLARVLMNNGYYDYSKQYLDKAKNGTYNDPELHFMYSHYYIVNNNKLMALASIEECLKILPEYYPALKIKEALIQI